MEKTYNITTFGCQMNEHDSETMAGMLQELGYTEAEQRDQAGIVLLNTCSVRDNADKRFFGILGQLKKVKAERPDLVVGVCGCMMQQQHIIDTIKQKYHWVDLVFGTHNFHELPKLLDNYLQEKKKLVDVWQEGGDIIEGLPASRPHAFQASVNIMYGCNNFCTYCIVPYTRGRERSRRPEQIIREVRDLVKDGAKEITLLGQNVNSYGVNAYGENGYCASEENGMDFPDLIKALNDIEGLERLHFMTSHPKDLSDRLISAFADCEKLCKAIHLPVQSGSTNLLRRMNRKYTKEDYLLLVEKLRKAVPDMAITTDFIVGFPGETEADFQETLDLVQRVQFDSAFTFLYSPRQGTPAAGYEDQIPEEEKHRRFNELLKLVNALNRQSNLKVIGQTCKVLAEGESRTDSSVMTGRTDGGKIVNFRGSDALVGQIIDVRILEARNFSLWGEVAEIKQEI